MKFIIRVIVCAFALWLTTLIVSGGDSAHFWVEPIGGDTWSVIGSYVLVALLFGLVNGSLGRVARFLTFPLRVLTLGLFGLIVNGALILVVAWFSDLAGFGLRVDGFWWGVLGALILSILTTIFNSLLGTRKSKSPRV
jgi:putative membrane protein